MANPVEEIIRIRFEGLQDAPAQFQNAIDGIKKFSAEIDALNARKTSVQQALPQATSYDDHIALTQSLGKIQDNLTNAITQKADLTKLAEDQYRRVQQYEALLKRVEAIEASRQVPDLPGPVENLSPGAMGALASATGHVQRAQEQYTNAPTAPEKDTATEALTAAISDFHATVKQMVRRPYEDPDAEIRRRATMLAAQQGSPVTNAQFAGLENDVSSGRVMDIDEDPITTARRNAVMNPKGKNFGSMIASRLGFDDPYASLNLAYGVMNMASQYGAYLAEPMAGVRLTPEQRQRSLYGIIPGATTVAGALIGSALPGGMGGWAGSIVGAGVGQGVETVLAAKSERSEALRLAAEQMAYSFGLGTDAAQKFAATISHASDLMGQPAVELATSLLKIAHTAGPMNMGRAASQQSFYQAALGDQYTWATDRATSYGMSQLFHSDFQTQLANGTQTPNITGLTMAASGGDIESIEAVYALRSSSNLYAENKLKAKIADVDRVDVMNVPDNNNVIHYAQNKDALAKLTTDDMKNAGLLQASTELTKAITFQKGLGELASGYTQSLGIGASMALTQGKGLAGASGYYSGQTSQLQQQINALWTQRAQVVQFAAINDKSDQDRLNTQKVMQDIDAQILQAQSSAVGIGASAFHLGLEEKGSFYESKSGITGSSLSEMANRGYSIGMQRTLYARQNSLDIGRANELERLARDHSNYLSPQDRNEYLSQAAQLRAGVTGRGVEYTQGYLGELGATASLQMSGIGVQLQTANAIGTPGQVASAQLAQIQEMRAEEERLNDVLKNGNLKYTERLGLQSQINSLISQQTAASRQMYDSALSSATSITGAMGSGYGTLAGRQLWGTGTGPASNADQMAAIHLAMTQASIELQAATTGPIADRVGHWAKYQDLASQIETSSVALGTVVESPAQQLVRMKLEHQESRQRMSPMVPGMLIGTVSQEQQMDKNLLGSYQQQRATLRARGMLTPQVEMQLASHEEEIKDRMLQRTVGVEQEMWNSVPSIFANAPSFQSRVFPSQMMMAQVMEGRGNGGFGAITVGYNRASSYRNAANRMFPTSDISRYAFGSRPGDYGIGVIGSGAGDGGAYSGDLLTHVGMAGGTAGGSVDQLTHAVIGLTRMFDQLLKTGLRIDVRHNDNSHARAAQTVNTTQHNNASDILRGGGPSPRY